MWYIVERRLYAGTAMLLGKSPAMTPACFPLNRYGSHEFTPLFAEDADSFREMQIKFKLYSAQ